MWDIMGEAGLIVAKHTCIEVRQNEIKHRGASLCRVLGQIKQEAGGEQHVHVNGHPYQIKEILTEEGLCTPSILREMHTRQCSCKGVKTKLIIQRPPNDKELQLLDDTPYGIKIIADTDRCLGITAYAPIKVNSKGKKE